MCTDVKIHPTDINLIVIAHEGGISLYNLKQEHVVRTFELIIPPGAIGGNSDPNDPSVFEERRPNVTCICFRPDGLILAAGYSDGCMAFWSVEDGEIPLLVRTIDRENVFNFDWQETPNTGPSQTSSSSDLPPREPIFRLAWSHSPAAQNNETHQPEKKDLMKDGTKLVILGGLLVNDPIGVHVFHYPKYYPNTKTTSDLEVHGRSALKASIAPVGHSVYLTNEVPDDFLLIPRKSPYFDGAEDPLAILISSTCSKTHDWFHSGNSSQFSSRTVHGYTFPPNTHKEPQEYFLPASFDWIGSKTVFISQLFDLSEIAYQFLRSSNSNTSTQSQSTHLDPLPLRGGQAKASPLISTSLQDDYQQASRVISEFSHKYRILVTIHLDYKIRFWDFSPALLLPKTHGSSNFDDLQDEFDLKTEFPRRLEHLTVDMSALFRPPSSSQLNFKLAAPVELQLNQESLDLLIILANRDSLLYTFHQQTAAIKHIIYPTGLDTPPPLSPSAQPMNPTSPRVDLSQVRLPESPNTPSKRPLQLLQLGGKPSEPADKSLEMTALTSSQDFLVMPSGFSPTALIQITGSKALNTSTSGRGEGQGGVIYALTDIGFLAIAHPQEEWIKVVDLRKSKLLFNDVIRHEYKSKGKSKENAICGMHWTIARTESGSPTLPRLLVGYANGVFNVINLTPSDMASIDNWSASSNASDSFRCDLNHKTSTSNHPISVFLFDSDGCPLLANLSSLRHALSQDTRSKAVFQDDSGGSPTVSLDSVSIIVFSQSVVVRMNLNGPQLLCRADLSSEPIVHASTISYQGSYALLLIDQKRACHILSLPKLETICRTCLPTLDGAGQMGNLSVDGSADVLEQSSSSSTTQLTTLIFGRDLMYSPALKLHNPNISLPDPPRPYSSLLTAMTTNLTLNIASWFTQHSHANEAHAGGSGTTRVTGAELDSIISGPHRPEGKKTVPQPPRATVIRSKSFLPYQPQASRRRSHSKEYSSKDRATRTSATTSSASGAKNQLAQNIDGLDERSDRLRFLNERFDDMAEASNDMLNQAKRIAQQQAAKSTFSTGLKQENRCSNAPYT
ncbi:hypothetical protein PGTUg99_033946 [Puccinia graminis f. sp. tritici]|uniref:V-SNARE coiled-coil homology domain-containing protein n=1 Tax=Puccinia graminis f. sp. tritici TaxID=56615 RepID=A0A5B0RPM9_PUCGR|nr:hypothetical protein PGTUg99_033946 [Puccinia graminis f. sp. tritici]